jgi:hypothetical protein
MVQNIELKVLQGNYVHVHAGKLYFLSYFTLFLNELLTEHTNVCSEKCKMSLRSCVNL